MPGSQLKNFAEEKMMPRTEGEGFSPDNFSSGAESRPGLGDLQNEHRKNIGELVDWDKLPD